METISFFRPDLSPLFVTQPLPSVETINLNPTHMYFKGTQRKEKKRILNLSLDYTMPDVGEMMLASVQLYPPKFFARMKNNSWYLGLLFFFLNFV